MQEEITADLTPGYTFTLTTACFRSNNPIHVAKSLGETLDNTNALMAIPIYLVIYGDSETIPHLQEKRAQYGHTEKTVFRQIEKQDIWTFQYLEKVQQNRKDYFPSSDPRHDDEIHLIQNNKAQFVLETIASNPFGTTHFGWTDAFLGKDTIRICEQYHPDVLPRLLAGIRDTHFHIQILKPCDKKYKQAEYKREYYQEYRTVVAGGLFICGAEVGTRILTRVKELFVETTNMGYGHGEEMLYLEILDEFDQDIVRSFGDYGQMWNNFTWPTHNLHYLYWVLFKPYQEYGYIKELFYFCRAVCEMMADKAKEKGKSQIDTEVCDAFHFPHFMFLEIEHEYRRTGSILGHAFTDQHANV
jgi:hypothetical protein